MKKDYYDILGINKGASKDEIKKAFYKLAQKYHPDKKGGDEAKFKEANEAYQVLSDDAKRSKYDQYGAGFENMGNAQGGYNQGGFGGFDFSGGGFQNGGGDFDFGNLNDIFSDFFGGNGGGQRSQPRRGRDISTEIGITFSDSILGIERKIVIKKTSKCKICNGSGAKAGTKMETCKTCNGQGQVHEIKRTMFGNIQSAKVCHECLGIGEIPKEICINCKGAGVQHKEEEISVPIPAGIRNDETVRLKGAGEAIKSGMTGDLYIKINVKMPSKISKRARELLEELKKEGI